MSSLEKVQELISVYGLSPIAKVLGVTDRGVKYWLQENPKKPSAATMARINELFQNHKKGINIFDRPTEADSVFDYKEKYIAALERENARLQRDLDLSLGELRHNVLLQRAVAETTQELLVEVLAKQRKMTQEELSYTVSTMNVEKYQTLKEEGNFGVAGK